MAYLQALDNFQQTWKIKLFSKTNTTSKQVSVITTIAVIQVKYTFFFAQS